MKSIIIQPDLSVVSDNVNILFVHCVKYALTILLILFGAFR